MSTKEQREAAAELSPEELEFTRLWLTRHEHGEPAWRCVEMAYPGHNGMNSCSATAARLIHHTPRIRRYIETVDAKALQRTEFSREMLARTFMRQALTTEQKLNPYVEWRPFSKDSGETFQRPWVSGFDVIPNEFQTLVAVYVPAEGGGYWVDMVDPIDEKTRQRAAELLGKMGGEFVERVEHSGGVTGATVVITADDPVKAAQDYMTLIKGLDTPAGKR